MLQKKLYELYKYDGIYKLRLIYSKPPQGAVIGEAFFEGGPSLLQGAAFLTVGV